VNVNLFNELLKVKGHPLYLNPTGPLYPAKVGKNNTFFNILLFAFDYMLTVVTNKPGTVTIILVYI